jgi:DnaJ-class molecular chaperone
MSDMPSIRKPRRRLEGDTCPVCNGSGRYPVYDRRGRLVYEIACPECGGDGRAQDDLERAGRAIAAKKMGLSNQGEKLPDDLWQQFRAMRRLER